MSLRGKGAVTGIGETRYSARSPQTSFELQMEASLKAIADAVRDCPPRVLPVIERRLRLSGLEMLAA